MFTGIVEGLGTIESARRTAKGLVIQVRPDFPLDDPQEGESIAVNGVCLTATTISASGFTADVSPETLGRTTLGALKPGDRVNLERALRLSDRLGGHIVSGHIDGVGDILERKELTDFILFKVSIPQGLSRYFIEKGSVAVDGISLTVNSCDDTSFSLAIIPHTAKLTTLSFRMPGDKVNIEVDIIGKYIEKLLFKSKEEKRGENGLSMDFLGEHGFL